MLNLVFLSRNIIFLFCRQALDFSDDEQEKQAKQTRKRQVQQRKLPKTDQNQSGEASEPHTSTHLPLSSWVWSKFKTAYLLHQMVHIFNVGSPERWEATVGAAVGCQSLTELLIFGYRSVS